MISTKLKNARGMSLVEVLVATALISIISAGVATLITNMSRQQKGVQAKDQQRDFTNSVRDILSNQQACQNTFANFNPRNLANAFSPVDPLVVPVQPFEIQDIRNSLGATVYTKGGAAADGNMLQINNMGVVSWSEDPLSVDGVNEFGTATFIINLEKVDTDAAGNRTTVNTGARNIAPDRIAIRFWLNEVTNTVDDCVTLSGSADTLWQISTASPSDIFRQSRVGIGPGFNATSGFIADLHVRGSSAISSTLIVGNDTTPPPIAATLVVAGPGTAIVNTRLAVGGPLDGNTLSVTGNGQFTTSINTGTTATIGTFLTVTQSATIGTDMRVTANATVGTNARIGNNLTVGNNITATNDVTAERYIVTSDARLKENLSIIDGLDILKLINGYTFNWKKNNKKDIGVVAQEIEKVLPELVYTGDDGVKRVNYQGLIPVLIESIHELEKKNKDLESRLQALESKEDSSKENSSKK